jgi:hypothetical protein
VLHKVSNKYTQTNTQTNVELCLLALGVFKPTDNPDWVRHGCCNCREPVWGTLVRKNREVSRVFFVCGMLNSNDFVCTPCTRPDSVSRTLSAVGLLTFDFATIAGVFCIVNLSFFSSLLCTTLTLLGLVGASFAASKLLQRWSQLAKEAAIYLLLFVGVIGWPEGGGGGSTDFYETSRKVLSRRELSGGVLKKVYK